MKRRITAKIPMRPYLLKFVHWVEKTNGPLDLKRNTMIPFWIRMLASKKRDFLAYIDSYPSTLHPSFSENLVVSLTKEMERHWRMFWVESSIRMFDHIIYYYFQDTLGLRIQDEIARGGTEKEVIISFLHEIGIEEDEYSFEAAQKAAQRWREYRGIEDIRSRKKWLRQTVL